MVQEESKAQKDSKAKRMDKFQSQGYNLTFIGKHLELTDPIKDYVIHKIGKVEKFAPHIIEVTVSLEVHNLENRVTINMIFLHFKINVQATSNDLYSAIDKASDRLIRLVSKYKTQLQEHKGGEHLGVHDLHVHVLKSNDLEDINAEIEEENERVELEKYKLHSVVAKEKLKLKMLTQDEAVMKLDLSDDAFLIYRAQEDLKTKVLYRRKDGDFSLVEIG